MKRFAISAAVTGGLLAGASLGLAGSANATIDANAPYYGTPGMSAGYDAPYYDAPYYGTPDTNRRYDAPYYGYDHPYNGYDAPYYGTPAPQSGTSVTFGTDGVTLNLPGGAAISAGPGGLGGWMPGK